MNVNKTQAPTMRNYSNPVEAFLKLKLDHPGWWKKSDPAVANPRPWPAGLSPLKAPVFAHNERFIAEPPEKVFAALTDAKSWPSFYANARDVELPAGKSSLEAGMHFTWKTFGTPQDTTVKEFEPGKALAWEADSLGTKAYHRWILEPAPGGTKLVTEELQTGPTATLDQAVMNPGLHAAHELWLQQLAVKLGKTSPTGWSAP